MKWSDVSNALQQITKQEKKERILRIVDPSPVVSKIIEKFDLKEVIEDFYGMQQLLKRLEDRGAKPLALAHSQVNNDNPMRFFAMDPHVSGWNSTLLIVNPEVVPVGKPKFKRESCLTYPEMPPIDVIRFDTVHVTFYDGDLNKEEVNLRGLHAQIFQHEIDHMNGKTIYDTIKRSGIQLPSQPRIIVP